MTTARRPNLLAAVDFGAGSRQAMIEAARLATRTGQPAALRAVFVAPLATRRGTYQRICERVPGELLLFARTNGANGIQRPTDLVLSVHLRFGDPAEEIRSLAAELGADAIVLGARADAPAEGPLAAQLRTDVHRPVLVAGVDPCELPEDEVVRRPACTPCASARRGSDGATWWCRDHAPDPSSPRAHQRVLVRHWTTWLDSGGAVPAF